MSEKNNISVNLKSMTGYGEAEGNLSVSADNLVALRVQLKSVNHRFLDIALKIPAAYAGLELTFQNEIRNMLNRGRVEIQIQREETASRAKIVIHEDILREALSKISELKIAGLDNSTLQSSMLNALWQRKEIMEFGNGTSFSAKTIPDEKESALAVDLLKRALSQLASSREKEGEALTRELNTQLSSLDRLLKTIGKNSENASTIQKTKLLSRLSELSNNVLSEDPRILTEVAILADRIDIREEIVRIEAHLGHFRSSASEGGRKLDFIVQELGREFNTIGSKTSQVEVSKAVIEAKATLERIREQLQNVE